MNIKVVNLDCRFQSPSQNIDELGQVGFGYMVRIFLIRFHRDMSII